jgi:hypothetical protein
VILQSGWTKYAPDYKLIADRVMVVGAMVSFASPLSSLPPLSSSTATRLSLRASVSHHPSRWGWHHSRRIACREANFHLSILRRSAFLGRDDLPCGCWAEGMPHRQPHRGDLIPGLPALEIPGDPSQRQPVECEDERRERSGEGDRQFPCQPPGGGHAVRGLSLPQARSLGFRLLRNLQSPGEP